MNLKSSTFLAFSLVAVVLLGASALLRREVPDGPTGASNVRGRTYYWDQTKGAWRIAAGAAVTALRDGEVCAETSSDAEGRYDLCVSSCCTPPGTLHLVASFGGLHDYFVTNPCGLIVMHDFYCVLEEQRLQRSGKLNTPR